jgi:hypothetical protein
MGKTSELGKYTNMRSLCIYTETNYVCFHCEREPAKAFTLRQNKCFLLSEV